MTAKPIPLDDLQLPAECACEFTPYEDDEDEESWHYLRRCYACKETWYSLHCPHDGYQGRCPGCDTRGRQIT